MGINRYYSTMQKPELCEQQKSGSIFIKIKNKERTHYH